MSTNKLFNDGWRFKKRGLESAFPVEGEPLLWDQVEILHDWLIYDSEKFHESSEG